MPELPEVETVRRGLAEHVSGRTIRSVDVLHQRAVRRHVLGAVDFAGRLAGQRIDAVRRRGKYLWLELASGEAVVGHLGMSGQMLVRSPGVPDEKHLRVRLHLDDRPGAARELRFVDQRTFGGLLLDELVEVDGTMVPSSIAHIARDPMDPAFRLPHVAKAMRAKRTEVKRALLDQTLVSGIGNIYADEALWRARMHWARPTQRLTQKQAELVLREATAVLMDALRAGGTSFDALYVNVNGESGYFDRSLNVYGREGEPCRRCGSPIRRERFMNRSSYTCPRCQRRPPRRR
ncbi:MULTISPECIES: bifunctional DNA-formamidopyrimidine glycosylase/DNA-(apurinic or apyrimidinic site) lyase [Thermocrispum]|jgi:formamidopyrimidine-DNA glycosylase|uniref:Formamidopyrimidine-DNA glycosylase n=1 Tax=Thermocrispum agreste TaxID=37925 RepID=A0A2W4J8G2_9PSEU|nr:MULTISPECIES: bifunctional DNA-formamidopyrimidine glycosylase/DNA-(apurinic or apyrimidinic site) lyase [Thermocrispum]PZM94701.1 MAG: bifunctional DNA-formamidopyrimidine glycosylase/DNA-(apurinic or apyrimidinic site) lyase [Thermocrispum agreste]